MNCNSCDAIYINGVLCHEQGCPDAWRDKERECDECGGKFIPEDRNQRCCCQSCENAWLGLPDEDWFEDCGGEDDEVERANDEWASRNMGPNEIRGEDD